MNLGGRNKIIMIIAGAVIVVAVVVILFVMMKGRGSSEEGAPAAGGFAQGAGQPTAAGGMTGGAQAPVPGQAAPGVPGGGAAMAGEQPGGAVAAAGAYPSVGVVKMGIGPAEPTRQDPFVTFNPPVTAPPPELLVSLPAVGLVPGGLRPGGGTGEAKIGNRRVAGLFFGDQAFAILEDENRTTYVVKPGDVVNGIRITAISRDSIFLRDRDGKRWEVPLRGMNPGASGNVETISTSSEAPPV